jgi:hypothetical protein
VVGPAILEVFSIIQSFYVQALLPGMKIIDLEDLPLLALGGLVVTYVENGAWCAAFGAASSFAIRPSSSIKSHMTLSAAALGCGLTGFEIIRAIYGRHTTEGMFDPVWVSVLLLVFAKGACTAAVCGYLSFLKPVPPDPVDAFT